MNSYVYICKKPTQNQLELAYSIGLGYPLIGCSSAEPISVFPNTTNVVKILTDTVHFTLPPDKFLPDREFLKIHNYKFK